MKALLISIRPKWVELIASGRKTIEIRKTRPKLETPFKCYIYCTKFHPGEPDSMINLKDRTSFFMPKGGAVIGEFICDRILDIFISSSDPNLKGYPVPGTMLTDREIMDYLGNGKYGYGWHISALKMYDEPKCLSDFRLWNGTTVVEGCFVMPSNEIKRPPQSWCYVEEMTT